MFENRRPQWIEARAASILSESVDELQHLGLSISMPPVPIAEICILRGLSINPEINLRYKGTKLAGMLDAPAQAISFEAKDILGRQHFSIAHELGHFEIHWPAWQAEHKHERPTNIDGQFIDIEDTFTRFFEGDDTASLQSGLLFRVEGRRRIIRSSQIEAEANYFAQFIVMPKEGVEEAVTQLEGLPFLTVKRVLSHQFEVSEMAMDLRLRQLSLHEKLEYQHQRKFFLDLSQRENDKFGLAQKDKAIHTITISPQSRLRTLIAAVEQRDISINQVALDFRGFHASDLALVGMTQALELALLSNYVVNLPCSDAEKASLSVCCDFLDGAEHIVRHLSRLGSAPYLGIASNSGQFFVDPQALITGNHVLLKLCQINQDTDLEALSSQLRERVLEWMQGIAEVDEIADLAARTLRHLGQDLIRYASDSAENGFGYIGVELQSIVSDGNVTGYRLIFAVGDLGLSLPERLRIHFQVDVETDYDAIEAYCFDDDERAALIEEVTKHGGYFQINTGDVNYHIGRGSNNFFTGLSRVPGLQITSMLTTS